MKTVHGIFNDFGGPAKLAKAIGVTTEHACTMRRRNSIPVSHWASLLKAAKETGVDLSEAALIAAHAPQPAQAAE